MADSQSFCEELALQIERAWLPFSFCMFLAFTLLVYILTQSFTGLVFGPSL